MSHEDSLSAQRIAENEQNDNRTAPISPTPDGDLNTSSASAFTTNSNTPLTPMRQRLHLIDRPPGSRYSGTDTPLQSAKKRQDPISEERAPATESESEDQSLATDIRKLQFDDSMDASDTDATMTSDEITAMNTTQDLQEFEVNNNNSTNNNDENCVVLNQQFEQQPAIARPEIPSYRKHLDEEVMSPQWCQHRKHIFILSNAGKPIFSRYGNEDELSTITGVLQGMISFVADTQDTIKTIIAGKRKFVFVLKGSLYLVCISNTTEPTCEIEQQLNFLYDQIISILTGGIQAIFAKKSGYDLRNLLGGTDNCLYSLIHNMNMSLAFSFNSIRCLRLQRQTRTQIGDILAKYRSPSQLFGLLIAGDQLVQVGRTKKHPLDPADLLLLMNFVNSSTSMRSSETWTPICLPKFNDKGFLYAYIDFLAESLCLVLISTSQDDFFKCSEAKAQIMEGLIDQKILEPVLSSIKSPLYKTSQIRIPDLRHFVYKNSLTSQLTCPQFTPPYNTKEEQKRLSRVYETISDKLKQSKSPQKVYYQATEKEAVVASVTREYELYATFSLTTPKSATIVACDMIKKWLKTNEDSLFIINSPVW